jgi:type II secretory pathway component GspD/PulD (secretin)
MRLLNIVMAIAALSATAPVSGRGEETPTQRKNRPRTRQVAALEQRVASLEREMEALRAEIAELKGSAAPTAAQREIKVIRLKNSLADTSAKLVQDLFGPEGEVVVTADTVTNSVIVTGPADRIEAIEALLSVLDQPTWRGSEFSQTLELHAAELKNKVAQAEADVKARQEQLEQTEVLVKKGFATKLQFEAEQAALKAAEAVLEQARRGLDALSSDTSPETKQPE